MAQKKSSNSKSSKKKNNGTLLTAACVVLGLLVLLVIFLVNKNTIFSNLKETAFFDRVFGSTPEVIEKHEVSGSKVQETIPLKNDSVVINIEQGEKETEQDVIPLSSLKEEKVENKPVEQKTKVEEKKEPVKETVKKEEAKKETAAPTTEVQLCFVLFDGDGLVVRKMIKRTVPKSDSPLTNSIKLLLQGPDTTKSAEKNCMTVIPKGTKLLGAKVQNGIAYLNFNENLEFNEMGIEGTIHSLEQIVYTATTFSTVSNVQILIEGEKRAFLGSEGGPRIDAPLSRNSF